MRILQAAAAASLVVAVSSPVTAVAYDLTGSWVGKATCKGFSDGLSSGALGLPQKFAIKIDVSAGISQSGRDVNLEFAGLSFLTRASGVAIPDSKKPDKGALGLVACGTTPEPVFGVTALAKVATTAGKTNASLTFLTVVTGKDVAGLGGLSIGGLTVGDSALSCTGTLKRTQTTDPVVGDCQM